MVLMCDLTTRSRVLFLATTLIALAITYNLNKTNGVNFMTMQSRGYFPSSVRGVMFSS